MGQGLNKVKRRIQTVNSTKKITSAMKLVSSVKFSKYQKSFESRKLYLSKLENFKTRLFNAALEKGICKEFFVSPINATKNCYVVITSNMGLCGSYKHNVQKFLEGVYKEGDEIILIGTSLLGYLHQNPNIKVNTDFIGLCDDLKMGNTRLLEKLVFSLYSTGEYKKISLIYTHYINVISYEVKEFSLLPIQYEFDEKMDNDAIFEPSIEYIFIRFLKKYLSANIYVKTYESILSEQSSRRNAMDNADKNAEELIEKLTLEYNKARQASITQEITEVVGGSIDKK